MRNKIDNLPLDEIDFIVTNHYKEKYRDDQINDINAFPDPPRPLLSAKTKNNKINAAESANSKLP